MERTAVPSDVYGALPVLDAVLAEADVRACDAIVITGDHVGGPQLVDVLHRLAELATRRYEAAGNQHSTYKSVLIDGVPAAEDQ